MKSKIKKKNFEIFSFHRIVNDLINQSKNGKYGDTSGIGQLIHQVYKNEFVFFK